MGLFDKMKAAHKQKQWSITDHCLREPFDEFVKNGEYLSWSG